MRVLRGSFLLLLSMILISAKPTPPKTPVKTTAAPTQSVAANLKNFDDLDFNVFSKQKWDDLSKSHAQDILVHWPDGHTTTGIQQHVADLKAMFQWAPDLKIKAHPVKFGSGEWTAVIGDVEGTFTRPMPLGHARSVQPTMRHFKYQMSTIGRWRNGVMVEEYLFWDNQSLTKQLGL